MKDHRYALISVFDKTGIIDLAKVLVNNGYKLISSGGTFKHLIEAGLTVQPVEYITDFPEGLDGRVKTMHPRIHAGILANTEIASHQEYIEKHGIALIDFVIVNLYPFTNKVSENTPINEAIELIDIGGPAMLRASAKNCKRVSVVCNPSDYKDIIDAINTKNLDEKLRIKLAAKAFAHSVSYEACISSYFEKYVNGNDFPQQISQTFELKTTLRYGENPHLSGALYLPTDNQYIKYTQLQGKELSYNNMLDSASAFRIVQGDYSGRLCATVVKHLNPSGIAVGTDPVLTFINAREADSQSAMGGIVALNYPIDKEVAKALVETFLEIVIAPDVTSDALSVLSKKKNLRILCIPQDLFNEPLFKYTTTRNEFGLLVQENDLIMESESDLVHKAGPIPSSEQISDALLGLRWIRFVKSNSIILIKNGVTLGIGAGQQNRVDCIRLAVRRAGARSTDSVLVSDAFMPMPDNPEVAHAAGVKVIVAPLGSIKDSEVLAKVEEFKMTFLQTPYRHFWH